MPQKEVDKEQKTPYLKGRGAQINPTSKFEQLQRDEQPIDWAAHREDWESDDLPTQYIETKAKGILNRVKSPDIPAEWGMNPYQGCEHGCVYCYARRTHPFWGYSAGVDFEQKILYKSNAPALLEEQLKKKSWKASPIMFAGNTDIYQPAERKFELTRQCLEVFWKYRHPVSMITKNSLIVRDLDILEKLNSENLVHVALSITTLDEDLRRLLEPRTATVKKRLETLKTLTDAGIPTMVMMAPIIPSLNDHEIFEMAKTVSDLGALSMGYTIVRLDEEVAPIFEHWINAAMPDRAEKVLNKIRSTHGGELSDLKPGRRMIGEGKVAEIISQQFRLAKEKFFKGRTFPAYNLELHEQFKSPQLRLF